MRKPSLPLIVYHYSQLMVSASQLQIQDSTKINALRESKCYYQYLLKTPLLITADTCLKLNIIKNHKGEVMVQLR